MLITAEQQQALIDNFIKQGCNAEQLDGFEQGMNAMLGLIGKLSKKDNWKGLLQLLKDKEISIDCGNVQQSITIGPDKDNYFELELNGFLHDREINSPHEYPSSETFLQATINFTYLVIDGIEYDAWTDEQKLDVYEILNEKFQGVFSFVELNY